MQTSPMQTNWGAAMPDFNPVTYAIPAFILLMLIEIVWARKFRPRGYEARDTLISLCLGLGSQVAGLLFGGIILGLSFWIYQYRLFDFGPQWWAVWWAWPLCFILDDLAYYWFHRSAHRVRWFWAGHVNHHSSQHYNLSTALRQTWTGFFSLSFMFSMPLMLLGFHPAMVAFVSAINLIYQFWIHTEAIDKMPRWFEAVMNTPSHHRIHHATNPRYLDRNYAGVFIVWDKAFGTFTKELPQSEEPLRYGIVRQLGDFNLLWAAFHEWIGIGKDLWRAPWRYKLSYIWREPGWSHDGSRQTSDMIRDEWQSQQAEGELDREDLAEDRAELPHS